MGHNGAHDRRRARRLSVLVAVFTLAGAALFMNDGARAAVIAVKGQAFGYHAVNITIFGGPQPETGPTPIVTLAPDASNSPQTASAASGIVKYGPATLFTSDAINVRTEGTIGLSGSVTSSADVRNVNRSTTQPTATGSEILTAGSISSTCTAGTTLSGSSSFAGPGDAGRASATLRTSEGNPNVDGDETYYDIPANPAPNTTVSGSLEGVGDTYRVVFNEQVTNPDGSLTVSAAHEIFEGPTAKGDLYIAQVTCGLTGTPSTTTTAPTSTTTTTAPTSTTTTTAPTSTTTTTRPTTTTTTTTAPTSTTTTTTAPTSTTTTTAPTSTTTTTTAPTSTTTTTAPTSTTTTTAPTSTTTTTTTTTTAPTSTTTTTAPTSTTTTTAPTSTTTTTRPTTTTTTTMPPVDRCSPPTGLISRVLYTVPALQPLAILLCRLGL